MSVAGEAITIRTVSLDAVGAESWLALLDLLDAEERRRAFAFLLEQRRQQFVVAHAVKRLMIGAATAMPPTSVRFGKTAEGKPWLLPTGRPHFNISHCESLVACALSSSLEVGIDVEPLDRAVPPALADWYCSPREQSWLAGLSAADRPRGMMAIWTLKEAVLKAAGCGLGYPLRALSVDVDPPAVAMSEGVLGPPGQWHVRYHRIEPGHGLALAWRGPDAQVTLSSGDVRSLLSEFPDRS